jgi:hypothetical protein
VEEKLRKLKGGATGESPFRDGPIDRRRLNMRDRRDLDKGGGYAKELRQEKQVRGIKGAVDYASKQQENTTPQTPGTGGMTQGLAIQQERQRKMGEAKERAQSFKPDLEENIYDIYEN